MTKNHKSGSKSAARKVLLLATCLHQRMKSDNAAVPEADDLLNRLFCKALGFDIAVNDFVSASEQVDYLHIINHVLEKHYKRVSDKSYFLVFAEIDFFECLNWLNDIEKLDGIRGDQLLVLKYKKLIRLIDKAKAGAGHAHLDDLMVGGVLSIASDRANVTICRLS